MDWFGSTGEAAATVAATTALMYLAALATVRLAGRRTVAQLSAFDAIITIALGSVIANAALSETTSVVEGATAFLTLLLLQVLLAWARRRLPLLRRIVEFEPEVVVREGELSLPSGPLTSQLTEQELWSRLRQQGVFRRDEITLAILEPTGKLSVLRPGPPPDDEALPPPGPA